MTLFLTAILFLIIFPVWFLAVCGGSIADQIARSKRRREARRRIESKNSEYEREP